MDEVSLNGEPVYDDEANEYEIEGDCEMAELVGQSGFVQGENPLPPAVGMEFETYEDVYYFYNCYAKEQGFGVRVSNTWYRKSKEKYRGKLSCSSAGFKKKSEANRPRPETRTGCPAMIKFRLMDSKRWRIIEVELEHNHLISPGNGKLYKSHKNVGVGTKRMLQTDDAEEVQKIRLFRTVLVDAENNGGTYFEGDFDINIGNSHQLKLKKGDTQVIHNYFCRMQLLNPNFFYVMDLNEKGCLKNVFWADARSRAAYNYFCDVVAFESTCLANNFEVPVVAFVGVNHHGQSLLLGSGLLAGETFESFEWLFRAWLTCMLGRPPQVILTDQCQTLQTAVADVFPRASHFLRTSHVMEKVSEKLTGLPDSEAIEVAMSRAVYDSLTVDEFEVAWEEMMQHYEMREYMWLQTLFDDRKQWVPVYLKETFLAGMLPIRQNEHATSFFNGHLQKHTPLQTFFDEYDQIVQMSWREEVLADMSSRNSNFLLKSNYYFEFQLSNLYTNGMFKKFQDEVVGMYSCFSAGQTHVNGLNITCIVREQVEVNENHRETKDYEVVYNTSGTEVLCICGLFNFKGYLCRHALIVLNQNGVDEIPPAYILRRWSKNIKRTHVLDHNCGSIDVNNPIHRYDHLHKRMMQIVEVGRKSHHQYQVAMQALEKMLGKLQLVEDHTI